jgi:hypothetical protein
MKPSYLNDSDVMNGEDVNPPRWQSVSSAPRDSEPERNDFGEVRVSRGVASGPGGWRPDPSSPVGYRTEGTTAIGQYFVDGDAISSDSISDAGAGSISSADLELLFWGNQWQTATGPSANDIIAAVQQLLASPYLSALSQYGFSNIRLRGSTIVLNPAPPAPRYSADDVRDMVWALIDDNVFPEPDDDGGRIFYMVFAPNGTLYADTSARGAHSTAHDTDLFDGDDAWIGWSNNGDLDFIINVFTHELVEGITDPGPDRGWIMNRSINGGIEVGDACNKTADRLDGLLIQAYWSEIDKACVIPWHPYSAFVDYGTDILDSIPLDSGVARVQPGPCHQSADYQWWTQQHHQQQKLVVRTKGFQIPVYEWQIGTEKIVSGTGTVTISDVKTTHPDVNGDNERIENVSIRYELLNGNTEILLFNNPVDGNYGVDLIVTVSDSTGGGGSRTSRVFRPRVWMAGVGFSWEDSYFSAVKECLAKLLREAQVELDGTFNGQNPGDPQPPWIDTLPPWIRGELRDKVREIEHFAHYIAPSNEQLSNQLHELSSAYGYRP